MEKINQNNYLISLYPNKHFEDHYWSINPIYQEPQNVQKQFYETHTNCTNYLIVLSRWLFLFVDGLNVFELPGTLSDLKCYLFLKKKKD